jgi:hypothetical protein
VFQFHLPPVRRLPPILWIRIKHDLREYIVEKEANDTKVIFWYHRRFVEVKILVFKQSFKVFRGLGKKVHLILISKIFFSMPSSSKQ